MSAVVAPASFKTSEVTFSTVKLLESGGKQAYLNYAGRPLVMQVGSLPTPFGLSVFDKTTPVKYSVELNMRGYDDPTNSPKVAAIYNALAALDEHMIEQGVKNSRAWFKADLTRDVVKAFYTPTVRFARDAEGNLKPYPPTLKIQLRQRDGTFETAVYDDKKRPMTDIPMEDILVKGAQLTVLIQCTGVWFAGSKYGLSWKAVQIRADKLPETIRGFAFLDDGDAAEAHSAPAPQRSAPAPQRAAPPTNQFANLDDDDDQVDDEEALAPAPKQVAKPTAPAVSAAQDDEDDDAPVDEAPVPVPPKKTVVKRTVVVKAAAKK